MYLKCLFIENYSMVQLVTYMRITCLKKTISCKTSLKQMNLRKRGSKLHRICQKYWTSEVYWEWFAFQHKNIKKKKPPTKTNQNQTNKKTKQKNPNQPKAAPKTITFLNFCIQKPEKCISGHHMESVTHQSKQLLQLINKCPRDTTKGSVSHMVFIHCCDLSMQDYWKELREKNLSQLGAESNDLYQEPVPKKDFTHAHLPATYIILIPE